MTYCASRLLAADVLPKCAAARTASSPSCFAVAFVGEADVPSSQTPASAPPVGYSTCLALVEHLVAPLTMPPPSQYCVITPDHASPPVPRPLKSFWTTGAPVFGSPLKVRLPAAPSVPW